MAGGYSVYILTNKRNGTLYVGVTNSLRRRVWEHTQKLAEGFTKKYDLDKLVYFEPHDDINTAIKREKQIKNLVRRKKLELIESINPHWKDLYDSILQ